MTGGLLGLLPNENWFATDSEPKKHLQNPPKLTNNGWSRCGFPRGSESEKLCLPSIWGKSHHLRVYISHFKKKMNEISKYHLMHWKKQRPTQKKSIYHLSHWRKCLPGIMLVYPPPSKSLPTLVVTDTGCGGRSKVLYHKFNQPFFRAVVDINHTIVGKYTIVPSIRGTIGMTYFNQP